MLSPALGSLRGIGVSHQAGALVQPVPQNPSSFPKGPRVRRVSRLFFFLAIWKLLGLNVSDFSPKLLLWTIPK